MSEKFYIYFLLIVIGLGCARKKKGTTFFNDFENTVGWNPSSLTKEPHFSGTYSNRLDSTHIYGSTFQLKFKQVSLREIKKVKVTFWAFLSDEAAQGKFVVEVNDPSKQNLFWIAKNFQDLIDTPNKWIKVKLEFTFPNESTTSLDNEIKIYGWNLSKKDIYIDDEEIEFVI